MSRWNLASLAESVRVRRFRWPLFVLLVSIGLTALAAIEAQRAVRSQRASRERALREYASFAAWSYAQHLADTLNFIEREAIGAVNHGDNMHTIRHVPPASDRLRTTCRGTSSACATARGSGPNPEAFFAIKIGEQRRSTPASITHPDAEGGLGSRSADVDGRSPMPVLNDRLSSPDEQTLARSTR